MIIDAIINSQTYQLGSAWEAVFKFLEGLDVDAEVKEYPILEDKVFARVLSYETKEDSAEDAILEAHRSYADVHMTLVGAERIAVYPNDSLVVQAAYDSDSDVGLYQFEQRADVQLTMRAGSFVLLLPQDAHMPGLSVADSSVVVKKVVVKIAMELLEM